jgi:deoxyribonuclease-1
MMVARSKDIGTVFTLAATFSLSLTCTPNLAQAAAPQAGHSAQNTSISSRQFENDPFGCSQGVAPKDVEHCIRQHISHYANQNLHTLSYNRARERMFQYVDTYVDSETQERVVKSVYTPDVYPVGDFGIPHNGVNAEHTFCQSWLMPWPRFKETRSDLFHIFPVHGGENSRRRNIPFADCTPLGSNNTSTGIRCTAGYEPPNNHKGKVARAMFYVSVTYSIPIEDTMESLLRDWAEDFPVTRVEYERAARISDVQGNRNPFIDYPEWVSWIQDY